MGELREKLRRRGTETLLNAWLRHVPDRLAIPIRSAILQKAALRFDRTAKLTTGVRVLGIERLACDARVTVARDVTLDARGGLQLEEGALIGFESVLLTHTHNSSDLSKFVQDQGMYSAPVVVGRGAWIGARVFVMPGVTIGEGAIVAAQSVVTRDVAPWTVVGGSPARRIRDR